VRRLGVGVSFVFSGLMPSAYADSTEILKYICGQVVVSHHPQRVWSWL